MIKTGYEEVVDPKSIFVFGEKDECYKHPLTSLKEHSYNLVKKQDPETALEYFKRDYKICHADPRLFPSSELEMDRFMAEVGSLSMTKNLYAILMEIIKHFNCAVRYFASAGDRGRHDFINAATLINPTRAHSFLESMKTGPNNLSHKKNLFDVTNCDEGWH